MSIAPRLKNRLLAKSNDLENASFLKLDGDAGTREYWRVTTPDSSYILAQHPPKCGQIEPFVNISKILSKYNFSVPVIHHFDYESGSLLLEDFGNLSLGKYLLDKSPEETLEIYKLTIDLLVELHQIPATNIPVFSVEDMLEELSVFTDYYLPYKYPSKYHGQKSEIPELMEIWRAILIKQHPLPNVLSLQDYHVENIMLLKNRQGIQALGLLDFQDARLASPIYDLVSILEDARIEVKREDALRLLEYYAQKSGLEFDLLYDNYHIMAMQRNCRILGVFVRKFIQDGNANYLKYIPLVEKYLSYDMLHEITQPFNRWLKSQPCCIK